ncbi:MAG TPA: deoxyribodipyrimidine photo-lyase, partial [Solirubrobacteraceae bacterium]
MTAIVWLRRDLRVHDHPALDAALDRHERVVPVFCLDDRVLRGRHASGPRTQFLLECLSDLDASLRKRGSGLVLRHGPPERELVQLARDTRAETLHFTSDVTPFARKRGALVSDALSAAGVESHAHPGLGVIDDIGAPRTQSGKPYTVFTPFHRNWERQPRRAVLAAPRELAPLPARVAKGRIPALAALGLEQEVRAPATGGESCGRERLAGFLTKDVRSYGQGRDALGEDGTSRLSPYLHFGCVSARELETRLGDGDGPEAFRRQLCWRDFYAYVLGHFPANARHEFQERYRGTLKWSRAQTRFEAWCEGRTGYPAVDAGMRQLK